MKQQFLSKLFLLIFVFCVATFVDAEEIERRGIAQVRSFSTSTLSLAKRGGRGTWLVSFFLFY